MTNDSPVELPTYCLTCGRAVALKYVPDDAYRVRRWRCPYVDCRSTHRLAIGGTIEYVVVRYEPDSAWRAQVPRL